MKTGFVRRSIFMKTYLFFRRMFSVFLALAVCFSCCTLVSAAGETTADESVTEQMYVMGDPDAGQPTETEESPMGRVLLSLLPILLFVVLLLSFRKES